MPLPIKNPAFGLPLVEGDTPERTVGCRHARPHNCGKSMLINVCAYVRGDRMCLSPPEWWAREYPKLRADADEARGEDEGDVRTAG